MATSERGGRRRRRLTVRKSDIHGKGLFSMARLRKGTLIGHYAGAPTRRDGRYVLWILEHDGTRHGIRGTNAIRFTNHSLRPNSEFDGPELYAIRDIGAGEEITVHYGEEWSDER